MSLPGDSERFSEQLYQKLARLNPGVEEMEPYEFRYALDNLEPAEGWASVAAETAEEIERRVTDPGFYRSIQLTPRVDGRIVLDPQIVRLTNGLFAGLVRGDYSEAWVDRHFYFDIRGFFFLHRTVYFTAGVLAHLGGKPLWSFEPKQQSFARCQEIGYKAFREANAEVDHAFITAVERLIARKGTPILVAIAGPTAAGKTEIVACLRGVLEEAGTRTSSLEMDNFLTDRDQREQKGIHTLGRAALHFDLFRQGLAALCRGETIWTPRYDFVLATSSHDLEGRLKPGGVPVRVEPGDVVFIEGNFPFLLEEIAPLIGIKVVYLTDDPIRLKRKWRRDIDYRKKYEPTYFRNRYFRDQFTMAQFSYVPQMQLCDLVVDTTGAALWATPPIAPLLGPSR